MSQGASIDIIKNGKAGGSSHLVAQRLLNADFNIQALRTQDILRKEDWLEFDNAVSEVAGERLNAVGDLVSRGLTYNLTNPLGRTKFEYQQASDLTDAEVNMSGISDAQADLLEFESKDLPIPIIHKNFHLNIRQLSASRDRGESLDVSQARIASRIVSEKIEDILFNGSTVQVGGNSITGYTSDSARNTGSVTASWALPGTTGEQIVQDAISMVNAADADKAYGPYILYVPFQVLTYLGDDYKANSDKTIMQRLLEIPRIEAVKGSSFLSGTNIVLVQLTSDTVDMINGFQPTMIQWESHGGMVLNFKVMSIMFPRIRSDFDGRSGIVHFS